LKRPVGKLAVAIATIAGCALPLAFDPFGLWPIAVLVLALFFWLLGGATPKLATAIGYGFGVGMFGVGVSWISESFQYNNIYGPVVPILTMVFVAFLALFPAFAGWLTQRLGNHHSQTTRLALVAPAIWMLVEWVRGWLFTGFTWLQVGYSQIDGPLAGWAPLVGVYGLGAMVAWLAGALVLLMLAANTVRLGNGIAAAVLIGSGYALATVQWTTPAGDPFGVALVQGNYAQDVKWRPENLGKSLDRYRRLTQASAGARLIVWPETSIPQLAHRAQPFLEELGSWAREHNATVLAGAPLRDMERAKFYNAMIAVGEVEGLYHKRHLVPFGEYIPFAVLIRPVLKMMGIPEPSFTPWDEPQSLLGSGSMRLGITICYEAAFGSEVIQALPEATLLVNVSNDAWFGDTLAPHQHLQITRMRALETGRFLVRATNTGISAIVGPDGALRQRSPQFKVHVLRGDVTPLTGLTPYARVGDWPVIILALLALVSAIVRRRLALASSKDA
jgi:apolipoprotein N-acyltransferase